MHVAVTDVVAEHVGPLIDAFTARDPGLEVAIETVAGASMAELLSTAGPTSRSVPHRPSNGRPRWPPCPFSAAD